MIDGKVGFTGGVNLADEYINKINRFGHWKDTALMLEGEAVDSFLVLFLQMWSITERQMVVKPYLAKHNKNEKQMVMLFHMVIRHLIPIKLVRMFILIFLTTPENTSTS